MKNCAAVVTLVCILALAPRAGAQTYLEYPGPPVGGVRDYPAVCSEWHEIFPNFCVVHHEDDFIDNGDGVVSVCDVIVLDGVRYHIDWAGPTYVLESTSGGGTGWWEPTEPLPPTNPVCSVWHQVHPDYCMSQHVDAWEDNGDGVVSACDIIWIGGQPWHVIGVNLDITVTEEPSPAGPATWGTIKHLFSMF